MPVSKAIEGATNYATRWTSDRVERRLDDRDDLLSEGLYNLENRGVTLSGDATGTGTVDSSGDLDIAVSLASSSFAGLASTGNLDVDGDTTMGGDLTFDGTVAQAINGPATASLSVSPGAADQSLLLSIPTYGNMVEMNGPNMGFFRASPVGQPSSTGEVSGVTAGSGTTLNDDSTFTGGVGTSAYTVSDIVRHLKNLGLLAQ